MASLGAESRRALHIACAPGRDRGGGPPTA